MPICYVSAYQNTFRRTSACLDRLCCCLPHSPAPVFMPMKPSLPHLFKELGLRGRYHRRGKDGRCPPGSTLMPAGLDGHRPVGCPMPFSRFKGKARLRAILHTWETVKPFWWQNRSRNAAPR